MKRTDLIRHLDKWKCQLVREGGRHSIYCDETQQRFTAVPRHRELNNFLVKGICNDLGIPKPARK